MSDPPNPCPVCGSRMEKGSIIVGGHRSQLNGHGEVFWVDQMTGSLEFAVWMQRFPIITTGAYRCQKCKLIMFSYEKEETARRDDEFHEQMLLMYKYFYGGGEHILEEKIESLMKQGLSREEAIRRLAEKEKNEQKNL